MMGGDLKINGRPGVLAPAQATDSVDCYPVHPLYSSSCCSVQKPSQLSAPRARVSSSRVRTLREKLLLLLLHRHRHRWAQEARACWCVSLRRR